MNIVELYRPKLRVLWNWKGGRLALLWRFIVTILLAAISFLFTTWFLPALHVNGVAAAIAAVIVVALFNAVFRSLVLALVAPFSLVLTGVLVLVLQVFAFLVVATWIPGVTVDGFGAALVGSFVYAIINTIL